MLHSDILCNLTALNVPSCAVKLIQSYLTNRSMCVRYKGATSSFEKVPGGGPQGGLLTGVLFCLQVNKAGSPCPLPELPALGQAGAQVPALGNDGTEGPAQGQDGVQQPDHGLDRVQGPLQGHYGAQGAAGGQDEAHGPAQELDGAHGPAQWQDGAQGPALSPIPISVNNLPLCHKKDKLHKKSYIDDLTMLEKISLSKLREKQRIIGPLDWHDRFNLTIPEDQSILQHQLHDLVRFTTEHSMVLNSKKTKVFPFNNSKKRDFLPQLSVEPEKHLEVIYQLKLVGVMITSDLSWQTHVNYTIKRVNAKLWQLARFRQLGASREKLIQFYVLKIRSILMFASVCFHFSLTLEQSHKLEIQQKRSFTIILGSEYRSYNNALTLTQLPRLDTLREDACVKWALAAQQNPLHSDLFPLNACDINTRNKKTLKEYLGKTTKFYKSTVPAMTRKLNQILKSHFVCHDPL